MEHSFVCLSSVESKEERNGRTVDWPFIACTEGPCLTRILGLGKDRVT